MMITGSGAYELRYLLTDKCTTALEFLILMSAFGSSSPGELVRRYWPRPPSPEEPVAIGR
jgi:hypothetical protein